MKQIFAVLTALMLLCALTACGEPENLSAPDSSQTIQEENPSEKESSSTTDVSTPVADEEPHVLVTYFSATGNTENIARHIQTVLDADLYEIVPEEPYTDDDLNYSSDDCRASREQNDPDARPAIAGTLDHPENYTVVFLGYPIWWGQAPKIIHTFLESYDFGGVTIVPFCTSGSSGIGSSAQGLAELAGSGDWLEGTRFSAGVSAADLQLWIEDLQQ